LTQRYHFNNSGKERGSRVGEARTRTPYPHFFEKIQSKHSINYCNRKGLRIEILAKLSNLRNNLYRNGEDLINVTNILNNIL